MRRDLSTSYRPGIRWPMDRKSVHLAMQHRGQPLKEFYVAAFVGKILRAGEGRARKRLEAIAAQVNALEEGFTDLTDEELREETDRFKERIAAGEKLDDLLPEAFAAVL